MHIKKRSNLLVLLLAVILIFPILTKDTSASPTQPDSRQVGYAYLDNGKVIHFWNEIDDYYLNATSGIQITNHNNNYWTHNIFCGGVKIASWQFYCNDAIPFAGTIKTDNETYFNMSWQKDIAIGQINIRAKLTYHIGSNDINLTIIPLIKNLGNNPINNDLAFAWIIKDIKIDNNKENDWIKINNSFYRLNNTLTLFFKNLSITEPSINETNHTIYYKFFAPGYRLFDIKSGKYLTLDWDNKSKYNVSITSQQDQYNAVVTLSINLGALAGQEEKSTELYWIDAGSQFARPDQDINIGGYTQTPLWQKIDEVTQDNSDYINSSVLTSPQSTNISLSKVIDPMVNTGHYLKVAAKKSHTTGQDVWARYTIFDGNKKIAVFHKKLTYLWGVGTWYLLNNTQADAITSYDNLTLEIRGNGSIAMPRNKLGVSWVYFEVPESPGSSFLYDNNGNLVSGFDKSYEYNDFNQLIRIRNNTATGKAIAEFLYNQEGNRIRKIDVGLTSNTTTYYIGKNLVRIVNASGSYDEVYYYAGDTLVAMKDTAGNKRFYHPDHLGSTTLVTDINGNAVENTTYLPYGDVFSGGNSRYDYNGKETDKDCLMYYGSRYYLPCITRWGQPDSIIQDIYNPQDLNHYAYVRNNPYKYVDPSGNAVNLVTAAIGAGIGAAIGAGASIGTQYYYTGQVNWVDVGKSTAIGTASGGVAGLTFGIGTALVGGQLTLGSSIGIGAASGITGGRTAQLTENIAYDQPLTQNLLNPNAIARDAAIGGAAGGVGYGVSRLIGTSRYAPGVSGKEVIQSQGTFKTSVNDFTLTKKAAESIGGGRVSSENVRNAIEKTKSFNYNYKGGAYIGYYDLKTKTFVATQGNKIINIFPAREGYIRKLQSSIKK